MLLTAPSSVLRRALNLILALAITLAPSASSAAPAPVPIERPARQAATTLAATKADQLLADVDRDGQADAGDTLRYTVAVTNTGGLDATSLALSDTLDPNTSLVAGSVRVSALAFPESYTTPRDTPLTVAAPGVLANDTGSPAPTAVPFTGATTAGGSVTLSADGGFSYTPAAGYVGADSFSYTAANSAGGDVATVAITVDLVATASDDTFSVTNGGTVSGNVLTNDQGDTPLAAVSLGESLANVGAVPADGVTVLALPAGGGVVNVTIDASGAIGMSSVGTTGSGSVTLFYQMQANDATTDTAQVTIAYGDSPVAADDTNATLGAAAYATTINTPITIPAGTGLLNNDLLGAPAATLTLFGGGDASPSVDQVAGTTRSLGGGGSLTVNADGSLSFTPATGFTGVFTFQYRIANPLGASTATAEINVVEAPTAVVDAFQVTIGGVNAANSVTTNDDLGAPPATVATFGGGSLGGAVGDNAAGATVAIPGSGGITISAAAGGVLTVDSSAGTAIAGTYTFDYAIDNGIGTSVATVTLTIVQGPIAEDDVFAFTIPGSLNGDLTADNGGGADNPGVPAYSALTFGGGSLGGTVTSNNAGASVALAGGTLTVNLNGSLSLTGATTPGTYTFQYRLSNTLPASDDATVTIVVQQAPTAVADGTYLIATGATLTITAADPNDLLDNDTLGTPAATLTSFGAGDLGGAVTTNTAGATVALAGGTLTVNADGSFSFATPTAPGTYTFDYRLTNAAGTSDATVTIQVQQVPTAQPDSFSFLFTADQSAPSGLFANNGGGADTLGNPSATLTTFGGGSLGGTVASNLAGSSVALAGGTLTVNANGTWSLTGQPFTPGSYTFDYLIDNGVGSSSATVTLNIQQNVAAVDDAPYTVVSGSTLVIVAADPNDLLDNDTRGFPSGTIISFGGGSLGGAVTDNAAGATVAPVVGFANGSLTVGADGSFSFTPPTIATPLCGTFTFNYRLDNGISSDDGLVTITVQCAPNAQDDTFTSGFTSTAGGLSLSGDLTANNGGGADSLGFPAGTLASFGGGDLGGTVTSNAAGATVAFAGGTITVNANGTFTLSDVDTAGTFTFQYRLTNVVGSDDATVTFTFDAPPTVITTSPTNGATNVLPASTIVVNFSESVTVGGGGISVDCGAGAVAGALSGSPGASATFNPTANLPGNATCTVTVASASVTDTDLNDPPNTLDGNANGVEGDDYLFSFQVAPEAVDDTYAVTPHLTFVSPAGVRSNDNPPDSITITGFGPTLGTANGTAPNGANFITAGGAGGRVVLNADGTFTFFPDAGDSSTSASFFYTITGGDTAQVTIAIQSQELVWFVDNTPGTTTCTGANQGTAACPAADLATVAAVDTTGDTIFIASGSYAGGITLPLSGNLVGDGASSTLEVVSGVAAASGSSFAPYASFSGADPVLTTTTSGIDAVTLSNNNTIRGLTIGDVGVAGNAEDITGNTFGTLTVSEVTLGGTGRALDLNTGTLSATFDSVSSSTGTNNISLTTIAGSLTINTGSLTGATGAAFNVSGGTLSATYSGSITQASNAPLVNVNNGHSGGTLTFQTGTLSATNGTGIQLDNADGTYTFNGTTTLNGGDAGIDILNGSTGTFSFGTGVSITNPSGTGFNLNSSNANVTYSGSISDNSGFAIDIDNHDSGTVTFQTGAITSTGQGLRVQNNGGGAVTFSNATKTLNTGANAAVTLATNTGATINFTGGGLNIDTTSGAGFSATGGGTVTVQGALNTIDSTTGTALNITSTTIGASGVTFQSISANGAASGIVLNTTGASGGLAVTGNGNLSVGGNSSGGIIQNTTSHGISLTSTLNPSFTNVTIQNTAASGIRGTQVTNFSFLNSTITGSGSPGVCDTANYVGDSNIAFNTSTARTESNVSGNITITSNNLSNAYCHGVDLVNWSGTLSSVDISNNTITSSTSAAASLGTGVRLWSQGSVTTVASITRATISNNTIRNFPSGGGIEVRGGNENASGAGGIYGVPGSLTNVIAITGNLISGQSAANRMNLSAILTLVTSWNSASRSQGNFNISNNGTVGDPISNTIGTAIASSTFGNSTVTSTISNNVIVANNSVGAQGIGAGTSSGSASSDTPIMTLTVTNNTISQVDGNGILAVARDANGTLNARIQNNTVAAPLGGVRPGIRVDSGNSGGNNAVCLNISGNTSAGSGGSQGLGLRKQGTVATTNAFGVNGMVATSTPGVESYIDSLNPAGNGTLLISATSGFTSCSLPLLAANGQGQGASSISQAQLAPIAAEAIDRWRASGISAAEAAQLDAVSFAVADLPGARLGEASGDTVSIDASAAGWGWFVDATPSDDAEFAGGVSTPGGVADGRMDLLTVVMHELGHVLGREDLPAAAHPHALMADEIAVGIRRAGTALGNAPGAAPLQAAPLVVNVGTLPAGKRVLVVFDVVIANPLPAGVTQISNQASVSATGAATVLSDDPSTTAAGDPTITQIGQFTVALPLIVRQGLPDLVVDQIVASGSSIQVVVRNQGDAAVTQPFWVDLYISPSAPPTAVNQIWQTRGSQGAAWGVTVGALPLDPGETLTLSLGDLYYRADLSRINAPIPAGTPLYAQADSVNTATSYGGVLENHEASGGSYNNIRGPVAVGGAGLRPAPTGSAPTGSAAAGSAPMLGPALPQR